MTFKETQAQIAKELTLEFATKLKFTDTSNNQAMNENLTNMVIDFYEKAYDTVKRKMEED